MRSILRVSPDYFDVLYVINPHMKVGEVDLELAHEQWEELGRVYESIAVKCELLEGQPNLPDMVFSANQTLPFYTEEGKKAVILSQMATVERRPEVAFFEEWFEANGYEIFRLPEGMVFEGMGDVQYTGGRSALWMGYGFRTQAEVADELEVITGLSVHKLRLVDDRFYHLDVCLAILDEDSALVYPPAFDESSYELIEDLIPNLIVVSEEEALNFACNAHCPDGKHVILEQGCEALEARLEEHGFKAIAVDTSEFIKAGGSVFCMKMDLL